MKRAASKRGRSKAVVAVWALSFVASQIALSAALDGPAESIRNPPYAIRLEALRKRVAESPSRPFILALGSSRTLHGLNPKLMLGSSTYSSKLVFNFGLPGHTPLHLHLAFERLRKDGIRPDALVVEFAPFSLAIDSQYPPNVPLELFSFEELLWLSVMKTNASEDARSWIAARAVPYSTYRHIILKTLLPAWQHGIEDKFRPWRIIDDYGYLRLEPPASHVAQRDRERQHLARVYSDFRVAPCQKRALDQILERARRDGIPTAILLMPESRSIRNLCTLSDRLEINGFIAELASEHAAYVIDARDWLDSAEFYSDGHHLIERGAELFTRRFAAEVMPQLDALAARREGNSIK